MRRSLTLFTIILLVASAANATVVDSWEAPNEIWGLTYDGTYLWAGQDDDPSGVPQLLKLNPEDGSIVSQFTLPGQELRGIGWDGETLWVYSYRTGTTNVDTIYQVDPSDGSILGSIQTPFASNNYVGGMTWFDGFLWITRYYPDNPTEIHKVDPSTGASVATITSPHSQPQGITHDGTSLWIVGDYFGGAECTLYQVNPSNGEVLYEEHPLGPDVVTTRPYDLTYDGEYHWLVTRQGTSSTLRFVYKLDVGGGGQPVIDVSDDDISFGPVVIGETGQTSITITNSGGADLNISASAGEPFEADEEPTSIAPGEFTDLALFFTPTTTGEAVGELVIESNDPLTPTVTINLYGEGVNSGAIALITPGEIDFGQVWLPHTLDGISVETVTIESTGEVDLNISEINIPTDTPDFDLANLPDLPLTLALHEQVTFDVVYHPTGVANHSTQVEITMNTTPATQTADVSGEGVIFPGDAGQGFWEMTFAGNPAPKVTAMIPFGDVDGDGISEVLVCHDDAVSYCVNGASAGTGVVMWEFRTDDNSNYGYPWNDDGVAAPGDLDGDGINDVILSCRGGNEHVYAISGVDGTEIWSFGDDENWSLGDINGVSVGDDINGDGVPEILAAAGQPRNMFYCFDGADGTELWTVESESSGWMLVAYADITEDGIRDVAAGSAGDGTNHLYLINGESGAVELSFEVESIWDLESANADLNDDGVWDFFTADFYDGITARSGVDGGIIWRNEDGTLFTEVAVIGDVNGDGLPESMGSILTNRVNLLDGEDGSIIWTENLGGNVLRVEGMPDLDGDFLPDVLVGTQDGHFMVLSGIDATNRLDITAPGGVETVTWTDDMDNNGSNDLLYGGRNGFAACVSGGSMAVPRPEVTFNEEYFSMVFYLGEFIHFESDVLQATNISEAMVNLSVAEFVIEDETINPSWFEATLPGEMQPDEQGTISFDFLEPMLVWMMGHPWPQFYGHITFNLDENGWVQQTIDIVGFTEGNDADETDSGLPLEYGLQNPYPNPFNAGVRIEYALPKAGDVTLQVVDVLGRQVRTLQQLHRNAGYHEVFWDGLSDNHRPVASGTYFIRMHANDFRAVKRVQMVK